MLASSISSFETIEVFSDKTGKGEPLVLVAALRLHNIVLSSFLPGPLADSELLWGGSRGDAFFFFLSGSLNWLQGTDLSVFTGSKSLVFCTEVWLQKHFSPVKSYENCATFSLAG